MGGCCRPRKSGTDVVEPVAVQAGSVLGNTDRSGASTQPYDARYGGFDGSWESPTAKPAKDGATKGLSLPAPLAELKKLLERDQLPLLPGFLMEKVRRPEVARAISCQPSCRACHSPHSLSPAWNASLLCWEH